MTPERQKIVEEIFLAALELEPVSRRALVNERCGTDAELQREVLDLLACHDGDAGLLDNPSPIGHSLLMGLTSASPTEIPLPPGGRVGHYHITGVLGAGGMGAVYIAQQERPRRTVALKVIRPGYASQQLLRRMEHEAELLGRLQHPNIAQIYEAGSADYGNGPQPFFAMELVDGPNITAFCEVNKLSHRQRLALLLDVCAAVEHAHQRGVIHRDIKPANILINQHGQAKVLDFGVARTTRSDMYATTMQTSVGQLIGTLPYMSPEQVEAKPDEIDTRTDIYALGVLIFEVLTGKLPHDLTDRSIPDAVRVIRDEAPRRISTIARELRGDVDTIVAKAMEKDKQRRYQSAAALAEDIRRHLHNEPITAKRDSAMYVLGKQIRRRPAVSALTIMLLIAIVWFGVYAGVQAQRFRDLAESEAQARRTADLLREDAEHEYERAETLRARTDALNAQLSSQLDQAVIDRGRLEALADNAGVAETYLWPQLFKNPNSRPAWWALWELFSRYPCQWAARHPQVITCIAPVPALDGFLAGTRAGTLVRYSADGKIAAESRPFIVSNRANAVSSVVCLTETTAVTVHPDGSAAVWTVSPQAITLEGTFKALDRVAEPPAQTPRISDNTLTRISNTEFAFGTTDGYIALCSAQSLAVTRSWRAHLPWVFSIAINREGTLLASAGNDSTVRVWNLEGRTEFKDIPFELPALPTIVAFDADGRSLFVGTRDRVLWRIGIADGRRLSHSNDIRGDVRSMMLSPDGKDLAVVGSQSVRLHQADILPSSRQFGFDAFNFNRAIALNGALVTLAADGGIRSWETGRHPFARLVPAHNNWVFGADFAPDGKSLASVAGDGSLCVTDVAAARVRSTAWIDPLLAAAGRPQNTRTRCVKYTIDGKLIFTGSSDGAIRIYNADNLSYVATVKSTGEVYGLTFSPDGSQFVTVHGDRSLRFWDTATRTLLGETTRLGAIPRTAVYSPDGKTVYSCDGSAIAAWDVATRKIVKRYPLQAAPWAIVISPDGRYLAAGTFNALLEVYDLRTGEHVGGKTGHRIVIAGLTFSNDSTLMISGGDDGSVKLWDPASATLLASFDLGKGEVPFVTLSPDGKTVAATCQGSTIALIDLTHHDKHILDNLDTAITRHADRKKSEGLGAAIREAAKSRQPQPRREATSSAGPTTPPRSPQDSPGSPPNPI